MNISLEIFLLGLLVTSVLTGLTTEAVKKILSEHKAKCYANTLAGIVSVILSIGIGVGYICVLGFGFTTTNIIYLVALAFMSWLCAMVGYDKVVQAISQFKTNGKG